MIMNREITSFEDWVVVYDRKDDGVGRLVSFVGDAVAKV